MIFQLIVDLYLGGIAFKKTFIGLGPAVYLLMIQGRTICRGIIGIANMASFSLGTPCSTCANEFKRSNVF